jgi:hypothetical protein
VPTFNKIPFFSSDENVTSGDLNLISAFLMNYNKNFVNSVISGNGCILNGLGLTANTTNITLASGFAFYNSPTSNNTITVLNSSPPTTLPMNGSILEIDGPLTLTPSNPHATLDRIDGIDLIANQTPTTSASRNFINPGTGIVTSQSTPTQLIENYVQNPGSPGSNIVITAGTPGATPFIPAVPAGYIRLATVYITHGVSLNIVQGNILYTMPYIWELQTFPGTPNTANQCMTLSDMLSAIKYQLNAIIGQNSWYNAPITNLYSLKTGPNVIRNAGMLVAQRGTSGTITAGAWGYTLDGWICSSTGANCAWLQVFGDATPPLGASLQLTPAGALTHLYVKQRIHSSYVVNLAGGNVTVQATIFNNTGGTVTPTITVNVPSAAANTWGGEPGTVVNLVPTTNLQACPNITVTTVAFTFALGTSVNWSYGLEVIFDFTNQVPNGREIYIGNVNLSPTPNLAAGVCSYPPTVQINTYAIELQNCLAFYEHLVQSSEVLGTAFSGTQAIFVYKYTVPKVGTVTISNSLVGNFVLQLLVGGLTQLIVTSLAYGSMGGTNAMVDIIATVASGLSTSNPVILLGEGSASLIAFSSEL